MKATVHGRRWAPAIRRGMCRAHCRSGRQLLWTGQNQCLSGIRIIRRCLYGPAANESYAGDDIAAMSDFFHERDHSRLVHYEGVFWNRDYASISDMESRMYAKPEEIESYLSSEGVKPYISCEYMHAMGNSLGGMELYSALEDKYEGYQGGFYMGLYRSGGV